MNVDGESLKSEGRRRPEPPSDERILAALGSTGFLFEQRVAQLIKKYDHATIHGENLLVDVELNRSFMDSQTGKSREIDVVAAFNGYPWDWSASHGRPPFILSKILIECKRTDNPYIVIGGEGRSGRTGSYVAEFDPVSLWLSNYGQPLSSYRLMKLDQLGAGSASEGPLGTQLVRMNRNGSKWEANNSGVFDGILYPLAKAVTAFSPTQNEIKSCENPETLDSEAGYFHFLYPVVVTDGPVYMAVVDGVTTRISRVPWATLERSFAEPSLKPNFHCDVVEFAHLDHYLTDRVFAQWAAVMARFAENQDLFNPYRLQETYGSPHNSSLFEAWKLNFGEDISRR